MVEADKGLRMSLIKVSDRTASSEFRGCEKLNPSLESDRRSLLLGGNVRIFALWKTSGISMMKCVRNTARKWQYCHKILVRRRNLRFPSGKCTFTKVRAAVSFYHCLIAFYLPIRFSALLCLSVTANRVYRIPLESRAETSLIPCSFRI